jgi:hypothetical protein
VGTVTVIVVAIVAVAVVVAGVLVVQRRSGRSSGDSPAVARAPRAEPPPMRGLEDALNQVTDRSGTTMAARLDAEGAHVDDLRDVDDTGPLLRRALDHVTPHEPLGETPGNPGTAAATEAASGVDGPRPPADDDQGTRSP